MTLKVISKITKGFCIEKLYFFIIIVIIIIVIIIFLRYRNGNKASQLFCVFPAIALRVLFFLS